MKRLFPKKYKILQKCQLSNKQIKNILSSCDRITDSNLVVDTNTELNKIQNHNSKLIKDYLINYAKDKGVYGGIFYEKNAADKQPYLFVVEFFIFQDVPTVKDNKTEYSDYIAAIATAINENGKVDSNYQYIEVMSSKNAPHDMSKYDKNVQIEGMWLECLNNTTYNLALEEAKDKIN